MNPDENPQTNQPTSADTEHAAAAPAPEPEVLRRLQKNLPVVLSEVDQLEVAKAKARRERELRQLEKDKSESNASFTTKIKEKEAEIEKLGDELDAEARVMAVDVFERFSSATGSKMIETVRADTGAVVDRRAASLGELQRHLPNLSGKPMSVLGDMEPGDLLAEAEAAGEDADPAEHIGEPEAPKRGRRKRTAR